MRHLNVRRVSFLCIVAVIFGLSVSGCSDQDESSRTSASHMQQADFFQLRDGWVKASEAQNSAAFGVLVNKGDKPFHIVSVSSPASKHIEMHETVEGDDGQMVMRQKEQGFRVEAKSEYVLIPGGNHLMLMGLVTPIHAGDSVSLVVQFEDNSTYDVILLAKDFTGANETYVHE